MRPKINRMDFLVKFLTGDIDVEEVETLLNAYPYIYGAYMILKPFDLDKHELVSATLDDESRAITIRLSEEKLAKKVHKERASSYTMCGTEEHKVGTSLRGKFVTLVFE